MTPDIAVVHRAQGAASGEKAPPAAEGAREHSFCLAAVRGAAAAFRRDPDTGSVFGKLTPRRMLVVFCAELLGTAMLLFVGCMGGVYGLDGSAEKPGSLQGALVFGMTVSTVIQIIGHVSAAHLNPAVTLCALLRGDVNAPAAAAYCLAEAAGALLGFGLLLVATPAGAACECTTVPAAALSPLQALLVEAAATAALVLLCMGIWDARNAANTDATPLKFGFYITAISIAAGPYTGASMNPARTLAPALWRDVWTHHWVYWAGPLAGSAAATLVYQLVFEERPAAAAAAPAKAANCAATCCDDSAGLESHRF